MSRYRYRPVTVLGPTLRTVTVFGPTLPNVTHRDGPLHERYPPLPNVTVTCVTRVTDSYKRRFKLFKIEIKKKYMFANYLFKIRANWRFNGKK